MFVSIVVLVSTVTGVPLAFASLVIMVISVRVMLTNVPRIHVETEERVWTKRTGTFVSAPGEQEENSVR